MFSFKLINKKKEVLYEIKNNDKLNKMIKIDYSSKGDMSRLYLKNNYFLQDNLETFFHLDIIEETPLRNNKSKTVITQNFRLKTKKYYNTYSLLNLISKKKFNKYYKKENYNLLNLENNKIKSLNENSAVPLEQVRTINSLSYNDNISIKIYKDDIYLFDIHFFIKRILFNIDTDIKIKKELTKLNKILNKKEDIFSMFKEETIENYIRYTLCLDIFNSTNVSFDIMYYMNRTLRLSKSENNELKYFLKYVLKLNRFKNTFFVLSRDSNIINKKDFSLDLLEKIKE